MKKIEARNIHKSFQELNVLQGIDLDVEEGEVIAVIGPSGSGKSTLLRCLNKLETINRRSEERRVGKECRSRWSPYH